MTATGYTFAAKFASRCHADCGTSIDVGNQCFRIGQETYHLNCQPIKHQPLAMGQDGFLFIDTETGGLDDQNCALIQVAVIATTENFVILDTFEGLIYPHNNLSITEKSIEVHGFTREKLQGNPREEKVMQNFAAFCRQYPKYRFAGYKAQYDQGFIAAALKRQDIRGELFLLPPFCLYEESRKKVSGLENYKLVTVAQHFGINMAGAHDAMNDIFGTLQLARVLANYGKQISP